MDVLLFGYWPLFEQPGNGFVDRSVLDKLPEIADPSMCMWLAESDQTLIAIFVVDRAREIGEHLLRWCEHKPSEWFEVAIECNGTMYGVTLCPIYQKSLNRWAAAHPQFNVADVRVQFVFKPLTFASFVGETFLKLEPMLRKATSVKVLLCDPSVVDVNDIDRILANVVELGEFAIAKDSYSNRWLRDYIEP